MHRLRRRLRDYRGSRSPSRPYGSFAEKFLEIHGLFWVSSSKIFGPVRDALVVAVFWWRRESREMLGASSRDQAAGGSWLGWESYRLSAKLEWVSLNQV
ncbi:hypothetical protein VTI74DRAFT_3342 [Chaetomium olivicolor]